MILAAALGIAAPASAETESPVPAASAPADESFAQWSLRPAQADPAPEADAAAMQDGSNTARPIQPSRVALR